MAVVSADAVAACDFCQQALAPVLGLEKHGIARCTRCGTAFCLPRPEQVAVIAQYQAETYFEGKLHESELRAQVAHYGPLARDVRRRVGQGANVLEVGCGSGGLLGALQREGLCASGIDVSVAAIERARSILGLDATVARVEDLDLESPVDGILALHVFEHLVRPSLLLSRAREALRPHGLLLLEVPDYGARMREQMGATWPYFLAGEHLQHFDVRALSVVLADHGFEIEKTHFLGGLGVLQSPHEGERVASARGTVMPSGFRGILYRSRTVLYRVPGARPVIRSLNDLIGHRILHRNAYVRVWARRK